jgi:hypothetical protein
LRWTFEISLQTRLTINAIVRAQAIPSEFLRIAPHSDYDRGITTIHAKLKYPDIKDERISQHFSITNWEG